MASVTHAKPCTNHFPLIFMHSRSMKLGHLGVKCSSSLVPRGMHSHATCFPVIGLSCLEIRENPHVSEFDANQLGSYILRDDSNGAILFIIRDLGNFLGFPRPFQSYIFLLLFLPLFRNIRIFPGFIFNLLLGRPWIHEAGVIPSFLH